MILYNSISALKYVQFKILFSNKLSLSPRDPHCSQYTMLSAETILLVVDVFTLKGHLLPVLFSYDSWTLTYNSNISVTLQTCVEQTLCIRPFLVLMLLSYCPYRVLTWKQYRVSDSQMSVYHGRFKHSSKTSRLSYLVWTSHDSCLWSLAQDHRPLCLSLLHTVCYTSLSPLWLTQVQMTVVFSRFVYQWRLLCKHMQAIHIFI